MPREVLAQVLEHELPAARVRLVVIVPVGAYAETGVNEAERGRAAVARFDQPIGIERRLRFGILARRMTYPLRGVEDFDLVLDAHAFAPRDPNRASFATFRCGGARFGSEPFRELGSLGDGAEDI